MKRLFNNSVLALLTITLLTFSGCSKEKRTAKKLEGEWNVTSYKMGPEDFSPILESGLVSVTLIFEEYDKDSGKFLVEYDMPDAQELVELGVEFDEIPFLMSGITYTYNLEDAPEKINIKMADMGSYAFDMDLDGDYLELSLPMFGIIMEIKAERK